MKSDEKVTCVKIKKIALWENARMLFVFDTYCTVCPFLTYDFAPDLFQVLLFLKYVYLSLAQNSVGERV